MTTHSIAYTAISMNTSAYKPLTAYKNWANSITNAHLRRHCITQSIKKTLRYGLFNPTHNFRKTLMNVTHTCTHTHAYTHVHTHTLSILLSGGGGWGGEGDKGERR